MSSRDADHFYDRVYLQSSGHLFTDALCDAEVALIRRLLAVTGDPWLLDLGCGEGRHLRALARAGCTRVVGLDRSAGLLAEARRRLPEGHLVRGDYRALPFADGAFGGAYVWYAGLFVFEDDAAHRSVLEEVARVLAPGARLVFDGANPDHLRREPVSLFEGRLPSGAFVRERCEWREAEGREHGHRRLLFPDGRTVEGAWAIRHYDPDDLTRLLCAAGFEVESLHDEAGAPFDPARAHDLVVVARRTCGRGRRP